MLVYPIIFALAIINIYLFFLLGRLEQRIEITMQHLDLLTKHFLKEYPHVRPN